MAIVPERLCNTPTFMVFPLCADAKPAADSPKPTAMEADRVLKIPRRFIGFPSLVGEAGPD
jgi:hypothetical protein